MALFDFFRRRGSSSGSGRSGGILSRIVNFFTSRPPAPEQPADDGYYDETEPEQPAPNIDYINIDDIQEPPEPAAADRWETPIPMQDDQELLSKYRKTLDTMEEKGWISPFKSDADAAEFLRVLGSEAWNESHAYWYSKTALAEMQDAIQRGGTAGALQEEYNMAIEKKSNQYLNVWEDWTEREW